MTREFPSKLPWSVGTNPASGIMAIIDDNGRIVSTLNVNDGKSQRNAELIVEAVNEVLELGELAVERDALLESDEAKSAMIADLKEQNRRLRYALAEAAIPLEAFNLIGNDTMKFAPSAWDEIQSALKSIREALFGKT